jgi:apolipoprotein N-acyltransferase
VNTRIALTGSSGFAYGLLMPPFEWAGLAWFALIPLLIAIASVGPLAAAGYGLGWGIAATLSVAWWFPGMLVSPVFSNAANYHSDK